MNKTYPIVNATAVEIKTAMENHLAIETEILEDNYLKANFYALGKNGSPIGWLKFKIYNNGIYFERSKNDWAFKSWRGISIQHLENQKYFDMAIEEMAIAADF